MVKGGQKASKKLQWIHLSNGAADTKEEGGQPNDIWTKSKQAREGKTRGEGSGRACTGSQWSPSAPQQYPPALLPPQLPALVQLVAELLQQLDNPMHRRQVWSLDWLVSQVCGWAFAVRVLH